MVIYIIKEIFDINVYCIVYFIDVYEIYNVI